MREKLNLSRKKLIAFGDVNVDLVTEIPHVQEACNVKPQPEAHLLGGGTIGNTATGAARLGIDTCFLGKIGRDRYGKFLKDAFEEDGVDTSHLLEDSQEYTVMVLAFIDSGGEKHNVTFPRTGGAHFNVTVPEVDSQVWSRAGWFHTSGISLGEEPCRSTTLELMRQAREKDLIVSFDLNLRLEYFGWRSGVKEAVLEAMALSDVVFMSRNEELAPLTGETSVSKGITSLTELYPSGSQYISPGQQTIIVRQGEAPVIVCENGISFRFPCFQVSVVDTLGAGDAFNAGFIAAQLNGKDLEESLTWAHGVAGFNLTHRGARGMPLKKELLEFISFHHRIPG